MKKLKKLSVSEFTKLYSGMTHLSCGIHFIDEDFVSIQNSSFSYIQYVIKTSKKEVSYIAIF